MSCLGNVIENHFLFLSVLLLRKKDTEVLQNRPLWCDKHCGCQNYWNQGEISEILILIQFYSEGDESITFRYYLLTIKRIKEGLDIGRCFKVTILSELVFFYFLTRGGNISAIFTQC